MKLSRSIFGVVVGAVIFLLGICMAYIRLPNYYIFDLFPGFWRSEWFWSQMPTSLIAMCLGIAIVVVSLIAGFVSDYISIPRRRKGIVITSVVAAFAVFAAWLILTPPAWLQRIGHRREVYANVQAAGGWGALKSDCLHLLLQTNQNGIFFWNSGSTKILPSAIATLHPTSVFAYSPGVVNISLPGEAYYGLEIDCAPLIKPDEPRTYPHRTYRKIEDGVYENY